MGAADDDASLHIPEADLSIAVLDRRPAPDRLLNLQQTSPLPIKMVKQQSYLIFGGNMFCSSLALRS